jgi:hypothetical protein
VTNHSPFYYQRRSLQGAGYKRLVSPICAGAAQK